MFISKILTFQQFLFLIFFSKKITYPSPCTGPQDLLVTHCDCEENEQKTLHKYAINQVTQCETEPQAIENTNVMATLYSKARATTITGYKFTATFSEKKVHCSQVSNGNKNRLDHESFYQSNIERLLHLNPDDCKNELRRLNITRNKHSDRKIVYFQVFAVSVHQVDMKLEHTISRIFQEMSLSELETLHQLCELERTQVLQSLALAVLKIPYAGYFLSGNRSNFLGYGGNILWFYSCTKKVSP